MLLIKLHFWKNPRIWGKLAKRGNWQISKIWTNRQERKRGRKSITCMNWVFSGSANSLPLGKEVKYFIDIKCLCVVFIPETPVTKLKFYCMVHETVSTMLDINQFPMMKLLFFKTLVHLIRTIKLQQKYWLQIILYHLEE